MSRRWGSASVRAVLIVIVLVGGCCAAVGFATAATTDHDSEWTVHEQSQDGSADDGNGSAISAQTTSGDVGVVVTASPLARTYPSDGTIKAAVGVLNVSATPQRPQPGEDVTVNVTSPAGDTTTVTGTTDGNGSLVVPYDLQNRPDGYYQITVTHDQSGTSSSIEVPVGPSVIGTTGGQNVQLGKETTRSFLARNGTEPVSGMNVSLLVRRDGTVVKSKTAETGANGFVNVSFVPDQPGNYQVSASTEKATVTSPGIGGFFGATDLVAKSLPFSGDRVRRGENASYSGRLKSSSGPVGNTNLNIEITGFQTDETVTAEAQTDENGFFVADYRIPNDTDMQNARVSITTDGGASVAASTDFIGVEGPPSETTQDVQLSVSFGKFRAPPGETVTRTITATDNGSAITNQEIQVVVRYTTGAPVFNGTVVTNDTGQAEVAFEVPGDAIDGTRLSILGAMRYQGQTYQGGSTVAVRALDIQDSGSFQSGQASIEVTNLTTGDAVAGVPFQFDAQYSRVDSGSFETGGLETDSTGTAQTSYAVPDDAGFYHRKNFVHRYEDARFPNLLFRQYPGELSVSTTTAAPGETVEISLDGTGGATAEGIVFGEVDQPEVPYAATISSDSNATITVPENATDGARINVNVWAVDADGNRYADYGFGTITVENGTAETGEAAYANDQGVIDNDGLRTAVDDWRTGEIDSGLLRDVVDAWRTGEQVA